METGKTNNIIMTVRRSSVARFFYLRASSKVTYRFPRGSAPFFYSGVPEGNVPKGSGFRGVAPFNLGTGAPPMTDKEKAGSRL